MNAVNPESPATTSGAGAVVRALGHRGFILCAATLIVLGAGFYAVTWGIQFQKDAAPLRKELDQLNKDKLAPYQFVNNFSIQTQVIDALGTDKYLDWILEDTSVPANSPVRRVRLFITYYTGQPDQVPHVPEVCYQGGGVESMVTTDFSLDIPELSRTVPVRMLEFEKRGMRFPVIYTFATNNTFANDRMAVRLVISQPFERYAYFSKIEVKFDAPPGQPMSRDDVLEATRKLFRVLLPELFASHYPDWAKMHPSQKSAGAN